MKMVSVVLALGATLVLVSPAAAATPQQQVAKLRTQLAAAKKANAKLTDQNAKLDGLAKAANASLAQATANLVTANATIAKMTSDAATQAVALAAAQTSLASANTSNTGLQAALVSSAGQQVASMNAVQLWTLLQPIYQRMLAVGGSAYTTSLYTSAGYASYDFSYFAP